jgi:hypothetical protein
MRSVWGAVAPRTSLVPEVYSAWLRYGGQSHPKRSVLDLFGVQYLLLSQDQDWPRAAGMQPVAVPSIHNLRVWWNPNAFPRVWIVHQVVEAGKSGRLNVNERRRPSGILCSSTGAERDLRRFAIVASRGPVSAEQPTSEQDADAETCEVVAEQNNCMTLDARLQTPGWVVLCDMYWPGWSARAISDSRQVLRLPVCRANGIMRAIALPAGHWRIDLRYQPPGWQVSSIISIVGWLLVLGGLMLRRTV